MTTAERLLQRLREAGLDLPEGSRLVRVYPSAAMRNNGAWSWAAVGPDGRELHIGSQYSMSKLLAAEALDVTPSRLVAHSDISVDPVKACRQCQGAAPTGCRICRASLCRSCLTDHHHEDYGTPADDR